MAPRGQVVKTPSCMWVRVLHGIHMRQAKFCLRVCHVYFLRFSSFHLSRFINLILTKINLERDVKLKLKKEYSYLSCNPTRCSDDVDISTSHFTTTSTVGLKTRYCAIFYVFKFYDSSDVHLECDVLVCPSDGAANCAMSVS